MGKMKEVYKEKFILYSLNYSDIIEYYNWYVQAKQIFNNYFKTHDHYEVEVGDLSASWEELKKIREKFSKDEWAVAQKSPEWDSKYQREDCMVFQNASFDFIVYDDENDLYFPKDKTGHAYKMDFLNEIEANKELGVPDVDEKILYTVKRQITNKEEIYDINRKAVIYSKFDKYIDDYEGALVDKTIFDFNASEDEIKEYEIKVAESSERKKIENVKSWEQD